MSAKILRFRPPELVVGKYCPKCGQTVYESEIDKHLQYCFKPLKPASAAIPDAAARDALIRKQRAYLRELFEQRLDASDRKKLLDFARELCDAEPFHQ